MRALGQVNPLLLKLLKYTPDAQKRLLQYSTFLCRLLFGKENAQEFETQFHGYVSTEILQLYFSNLQSFPGLRKDIEKCLDAQYDGTWRAEVGGRILSQDDGLIFDIYRGAEHSELEALLADIDNKPTHQKLRSISDYLNTWLDRYAKDSAADIGLYSTLARSVDLAAHLLASADEQEYIALGHLTDLAAGSLSHQYLLTPEELRSWMKDERTLGMFHVHPDGSAPSDTDLDNSRAHKIPFVVISGKEDYRSSGYQIYVYYSGRSNIAYDSKL